MTNDLITFGIWFYIGRILFFGGFLLLTLVAMHPWLLLVAVGIWWLARQPTDAATERSTANLAAPPNAAGATQASTPSEGPS